MRSRVSAIHTYIHTNIKYDMFLSSCVVGFRLSRPVFNLDEKTSGLDCHDRLKYLASDVSPFLAEGIFSDD